MLIQAVMKYCRYCVIVAVKAWWILSACKDLAEGSCLLKGRNYCSCNDRSKTVTCSRFELSLDEMLLPALIPKHVRALTLRRGSSNTRVTLSPLHLARFKLLENLNLSRDLITGLETDTFRDFQRLRSINLSSNRIRVLKPDTFSGNLPTLKEIDLTKNKIIALIDGSFAAAKSLQILDLRDNPIGFLSDCAFDGLSKLRILKLSGCKMRCFPVPPFRPLISLQSFEASKMNYIREIPDHLFRENRMLTSLHFSNMRRLYKVGNNSFVGLATLRHLTLYDCNFTRIPKALQRLVSLKTLNLSINPIEMIRSNDFSGLVNLERLILRQNKLHVIMSTSFRSLQNLKTLDLTNNRLVTLRRDAFPANLSNLGTMFLDRNMWTCDCRIKWIMIETHFKPVSSCNTPPELQGMKFDTLLFLSLPKCLAPAIKSSMVTETIIPFGSNVKLPCVATGTPQPIITWHTPLGQQTLINSPPSSGEVTLFISNATASHSGVYTCVATNEAGKDRKNVTLEVSRVHTSTSLRPGKLPISNDYKKYGVTSLFLIGGMSLSVVVAILLAIWGTINYKEKQKLQNNVRSMPHPNESRI
ncbi:unnamed protein product [Clavelina lepadiformis]|uniref:Ig-like domain-containing protein n=1 Tax=Clavelina lepadiformis TaxID=159417 RepID=A0ABP0EWF8_CLALP